MANNIFKGIPISSKSMMDVPVQVVSQPSVYDVIARAGEQSTVQDTVVKEPAKAEAVRSGEVKVSALEQPEFDDFMASSVVAIPRRMPTMLDLRCKDPNYRPRWVNFKADGGRRVDECKADGWTIALREEVLTREGLPLDPDNTIVQKDCIKCHDVVLMKVQTWKLFGWLKSNAEKSLRTVSRTHAHNRALSEANAELSKGLNEIGCPKERRDDISIYIPSGKEADKA